MRNLGFEHRFVPATEPESSVALVLLHGTGGDQHDLIPVGQSLLRGAALLSPRGKVLENGMSRFFRRFAEGVFDVEDLKQRTHELAAFIAAARHEYSLPANLVAVGYSNGANIAASLMLLYPDLMAGAVLLRPMVPFTPDTKPALNGKPLLLSAGTRDPIALPDQTRQLANLFQSAGADVSIHWHTGGHELGEDDLTEAQRWLTDLQVNTTLA